MTGKEALIKWVNDIYYDERKVAGILTESMVDMESGRFEHAVLGIGVNVKPPADGFPRDIADVAGAVLDDRTGAVRCRKARPPSSAPPGTCTGTWPTPRSTTSTAAGASCWANRSSCARAPRARAPAPSTSPDFKLVVELPDKTRRELYGGSAPACFNPLPRRPHGWPRAVRNPHATRSRRCFT